MTATIAPRKPRVLVVDDEPAVIRDIYQALARDHQVLQATKSDRALALAETMQPDLVLIDIALGAEDGYALASAIRQVVPAPFAFLIEAGNDRAKGIGLGTLGFLSKPLERGRILQAVNTWLKRGKALPASGDAVVTLRPDAMTRLGAVAEIDSAAGLKNVGGSRDLYLAVLKSLCGNHAGITADLVSALAEGDHAAAALLSHTAKTLLRTIGAAQLGEMAFDIERAVKAGAAHPLPVDELRIRFERMIDDLRVAILADAARLQP